MALNDNHHAIVSSDPAALAAAALPENFRGR